MNEVEKINNDPFMNLHEAAAYLHITPDSLYTLRRLKRIPVHRFGRKIRFRRSDLETFIRDSKEEN